MIHSRRHKPNKEPELPVLGRRPNNITTCHSRSMGPSSEGCGKPYWQEDPGGLTLQQELLVLCRAKTPVREVPETVSMKSKTCPIKIVFLSQLESRESLQSVWQYSRDKLNVPQRRSHPLLSWPWPRKPGHSCWPRESVSASWLPPQCVANQAPP